MNYYTLFDFEIEPFANSPDPRLFYQSKNYLEVLQKLEISIRLKRGLNIVIGDIGIGKTTISRQLVQKISFDKKIEYYLILDPGFKDSYEFLSHILQLMEQSTPDPDLNENNIKERIKSCLFTRGVDNSQTLVLLIDEGQKLSLENLEVLRELLNFETNDQKLLQIVIFAQNEFEQSLAKVPNFQDRISFRYNLTTLNFKESKKLIQYRLNRSFLTGKNRRTFSLTAFIAIYIFTKGSPRKMVNLCHHVILLLILKKKKKSRVFPGQILCKKIISQKNSKV
jgi:general secretion pathway protein A